MLTGSTWKIGVEAADSGQVEAMALSLVSWQIFENFQQNGNKISLQTIFSVLDHACGKFSSNSLADIKRKVKAVDFFIGMG